MADSVPACPFCGGRWDDCDCIFDEPVNNYDKIYKTNGAGEKTEREKIRIIEPSSKVGLILFILVSAIIFSAIYLALK